MDSSMIVGVGLVLVGLGMLAVKIRLLVKTPRDTSAHEGLDFLASLLVQIALPAWVAALFLIGAGIAVLVGR